MTQVDKCIGAGFVWIPHCRDAVQAGGAERSEASAPPASSAPSGHDAAPQRRELPRDRASKEVVTAQVDGTPRCSARRFARPDSSNVEQPLVIADSPVTYSDVEAWCDPSAGNVSHVEGKVAWHILARFHW